MNFFGGINWDCSHPSVLLHQRLNSCARKQNFFLIPRAIVLIKGMFRSWRIHQGDSQAFYNCERLVSCAQGKKRRDRYLRTTTAAILNASGRQHSGKEVIYRSVFGPHTHLLSLFRLYANNAAQRCCKEARDSCAKSTTNIWLKTKKAASQSFLR